MLFRDHLNVVIQCVGAEGWHNWLGSCCGLVKKSFSFGSDFRLVWVPNDAYVNHADAEIL